MNCQFTNASKKSIFIVLSVHNRKAVTEACLYHLDSLGYLESCSIVVVDDGSTDGTEELIRSHYRSVKLLYGDGTLWWTGAITLGMQYAYEQKAEYIIWLNDDCLITPGTIESLVKTCRSTDKAIVGIQGYESDDSSTLSFGGKKSNWRSPLVYDLKEFPFGKVTACDMLSGNLVCLPAAAITECGYPDSESFPHYGGDTAYLQNLKRKGFQLFVDTRLLAKNTVLTSSSSNISNWFTADGPALKIIKLLTTPQSSLYWRLYLHLNVSQYGLFGYALFIAKYALILVRVIAFTILRLLLSHSIRMKLSRWKSGFVVVHET